MKITQLRKRGNIVRVTLETDKVDANGFTKYRCLSTQRRNAKALEELFGSAVTTEERGGVTHKIGEVCV